VPHGAGFEQSWHFEKSPDGIGDLEVRIATALPYRFAAADGLHFDGVRYGHATWVDAAGTRTPLPSRYEPGAIRLTVPEALLKSSRFPAVLDPFVTPEYGFGTPVRGPPANFDFDPVVGFNGTDYVVAWVDFRRSRQCDLFGTRVATDGGVRDAVLQLIPWGGSDCASPTDADRDGTNVVLAFDSAGMASIARITPLAVNLDPNGRALASGRDPRLSRGTSETLVAYSAGFPSTELRMLRILPDAGIDTGDGGLVVANTMASESIAGRNKDLAFDGTEYLMCWVDGRADEGDIYGVFLNFLGDRLGPEFVIFAGAGLQRRCSVAFGGTGFLVSWENEASGDLGVRRVQPGPMLSATVTIGTAGTIDKRPALAFDGADFILGWEVTNPSSIRAARISQGGLLLDPTGVLVEDMDVDTENGRVALATNGAGQSLLVFLNSRLHVAAKRLAGSTPIDATALTFATTADEQLQATMASIPNGVSLLTWSANHNGISAARLPADGGATDPIVLETGSDTRSGASVATDGTQFWVAWSADFTFRGRFVSATGVLSPLQTVTTMPFQSFGGAVARDGPGFLNVWGDARTTPAGIRARRNFPDGGLGPEFEVSPGGGSVDKNAIAVAANDAGIALVVWEYNTGVVQAVRVSGTTTLDAPPIQLASNRYYGRPSVTSDGRDFLVVWEFDTSTSVALRGAFIPGAGPFDGGVFTVGAAASDQEQPVARWDGRDFVVAWETTDDVRRDIYAAVVLRDGGSLPRFPLATLPGQTEIYPAISAPAPGQWWFAHSRFDTAPLINSQRIHARLYAGGHPGTSCTTALACADGFCVDGVCCTSACAGGTSDCQTCATGTCLPAPNTLVCRGAVDGCDQAERCTGSSAACPADALQPNGTMCAQGVCSAGLCAPVDGGLPVGTQALVTLDGGCGALLEYQASGRPMVVGAGPVGYALTSRSIAAVPAGAAVDAGLFGWTPSDQQTGHFELRITATGSAGIDNIPLDVDVTCAAAPDAGTPAGPRMLAVGCGCKAASSPLFLLLSAAWVLRRTGARRRASRVPGSAPTAPTRRCTELRSATST